MQVISLSGKKQSGKNTTANYIAGRYLAMRGLIDNFNIRDDGSLFIRLEGDDICDLNLDRLDRASTQQLLPYVHIYSWANLLKISVSQFFDIPLDLVFGDNEAKNTLTDVKWSYFKIFKMNGKGKMTVREVLESFGNGMRMIDPDFWVKPLVARIKREQPELAIICDTRFGNEAVASENLNALLIRLLRNIHNSDHPSETALDNYEFYNKIDNNNLTIPETNAEVEKLITPILWPDGKLIIYDEEEEAEEIEQEKV